MNRRTKVVSFVGAVFLGTAVALAIGVGTPASLAVAAPSAPAAALVPVVASSPAVAAEPTVVAAASRSSRVSVIDVTAIRAEMARRRGHPLILHFWASWCGPCLEELPLINKLAEHLRASGADVLSISLDNPEQRADHVLALLRERAPALTAAVARIDDPDVFISAFRGLRGQPWEGSIPALFAYDKKGALALQILGEASAADLAALARGAGVKAPRAVAGAPRTRRPR